MKKKLVSVIIPAYNESNVIERLLLSIKSQTYNNIEIVVVDDDSTDKTAQVARKYTSKVYTRKHAERSIQRNFGAQKTKGQFLLFLDADMELSKNVISECVNQILTDSMIGAIAIPEKSIAKLYWEKVKAFERSFYNDSGDVYTDAARFFSREVFSKVRGYDESITGPEDWDLPDRIKALGYKVDRISSYIFHHERVVSPFSVAKKKFYYGLKSYRYFEKNNIKPFGPKTVYLLRPIFYKKWTKIVAHPFLSISMFFMLTCEQILGGLGYLIGKYRKL